jgi:tetratricopeptide (TPR) repeat protein
MNIGEFEEAADLFERALGAGFAPPAPTRIETQNQYAFCFERLGRYAEGLKLLNEATREALTLPEKLVLETLIGLINTRGAIYWRLERYNEAIACFSGDVPLLRKRRGDEAVPISYNNLGFTYYKTGDQALARKYLLLAYREASDQGDFNSLLVSYVNLGYVYACTRKPQVGERIAKKAASMAAEADNRFQRGRALDALAHALRAQKRGSEAAEAWREAARVFTTCGAPEAQEVIQHIESLHVD